MKLALSLVLVLSGLMSTAAFAETGKVHAGAATTCDFHHDAALCGTRSVSADQAVIMLVQLSRDEHDRLRLELRGLHRPVRVGSLEELGVAARLSASERRLLRRQLREQLQSDVTGTVVVNNDSTGELVPDTSDRVGGEAPGPLQPESAVRVIPASTARPDPIRLDSPLLEVQAPLSVSN
jgi:hypothetical protein